MKIEINNENKARFFALYLGQMVEYPETDGRIVRHKLVAVGFEYLHLNYKRKVKGCIGNEISFSNKNTNHNSNALNAKLELKQLSKISDEDAIEVAKIFRWTSGVLEVQAKTFLSQYLDYHNSNISSSENFHLCDYLRSKGYVLPWMGLSVEEMVGAGWIKLN